MITVHQVGKEYQVRINGNNWGDFKTLNRAIDCARGLAKDGARLEPGDDGYKLGFGFTSTVSGFVQAGPEEEVRGVEEVNGRMVTRMHRIERKRAARVVVSIESGRFLAVGLPFGSGACPPVVRGSEPGVCVGCFDARKQTQRLVVGSLFMSACDDCAVQLR